MAMEDIDKSVFSNIANSLFMEANPVKIGDADKQDINNIILELHKLRRSIQTANYEDIAMQKRDLIDVENRICEMSKNIKP